MENEIKKLGFGLMRLPVIVRRQMYRLHSKKRNNSLKNTGFSSEEKAEQIGKHVAC